MRGTAGPRQTALPHERAGGTHLTDRCIELYSDENHDSAHIVSSLLGMTQHTEVEIHKHTHTGSNNSPD